MLIRDAEVWLQGRADVRVAGNAIEAVGMLQPRDGETVIDAHGGLCFPDFTIITFICRHSRWRKRQSCAGRPT